MLLPIGWLCAASAAHGSPAPASLEFIPYPLNAEIELIDQTSAAAHSSTRESGDGSDPGDPLARTANELHDALARRIEALAAELSAEGYRSGGLIDELAALAAIYQEQDEHHAAIGALDWALENSRLHHGLYSLEHAPLLEQMIASQRALHDYDGSASVEARLMELVYRNGGDPRVTTILAASADRRMADAHRLLEEGDAEQIFFGVSSAPVRVPRLIPASRYRAVASLQAARRQYSDAVLAAVRSGRYAVLDLLELEERIASTFFIQMTHPDLASSGSTQWLCRSGEAFLKNSAENIAKFRHSPTAEAAALIKLADWQLLCSQNGKALGTYDAAYASLLARGAAPDDIDTLLPAEAPVALPGFAGPPARDGGAEPYQGYVDVSFVIGKYGSTRGIQVRGESPGTTKAIVRALISYISRHRFRPLFAQGELAGRDRVELRYYYRY